MKHAQTKATLNKSDMHPFRTTRESGPRLGFGLFRPMVPKVRSRAPPMVQIYLDIAVISKFYFLLIKSLIFCRKLLRSLDL